MSHARHFAVAAALAASRIIPRDVPVLGCLTRSSLMTFSAAAALAYAFVDLVKDDGEARPRRKAPARAPVRPYEEWTREELYHRAQELDIEGRSRLNKDELIEVLRQYD